MSGVNRKLSLLRSTYARIKISREIHRGVLCNFSEIQQVDGVSNSPLCRKSDVAPENTPQKITLGQARNAFKSIAEIPVIQTGRILSINHTNNKNEISGKELILTATYHQRDLEVNKTRIFERFYSLEESNREDGKVSFNETSVSPFVSELNDVIIHAYSPDGTRKAIIKEVNNSGKVDQYLEIWSQSQLVKSSNLSEVNKSIHGAVYDKGTFSSLQWSDDNYSLLFVAEKSEHRDNQVQNVADDETLFYNKECDRYLYKKDWGELMQGHCNPVIVTYDTVCDSFEVVEDFPLGFSPGQAIWGPEKSIIFVGWVHNPKEAGLLYSEARESIIFQVQQRQEGNVFKQLSEDNSCVAYPRLSPDKSKLAYLQADLASLHGLYERVMTYDFVTERNRVICQSIEDRCDNTYKVFPLFIESLTSRCWLQGEHCSCVAFFTSRGLTENTILVCASSGEATLLDLPKDDGAQRPLDSHQEFLLLSNDCLRCPPELQLIRLTDIVKAGNVSHCITSRRVINQVKTRRIIHGNNNNSLMTDLVIHVIDVPLGNAKLPSLLIKPRYHASDHKLPLAAIIHGGPHMIFPDTFNLFQVTLSKLGFAVLLVNYRGSIGFDHESMRSILGKIKYQDVDDCHQIINYALHKFDLDKNNIFAFGGSHGGFIVAHLCARYQDLFRSVAIRNAPFNMASMVDSTDIPDWCYRVCGLKYSPSMLPKQEDYMKMLQVSPLFEVDKITTPILFLVGAQDVRTHSTLARTFHHALRSLGRKARLIIYPDGHPLTAANVEVNMFLNIFKWFRDHIEVH